jgi:hypothetical protein
MCQYQESGLERLIGLRGRLLLCVLFSFLSVASLLVSWVTAAPIETEYVVGANCFNQLAPPLYRTSAISFHMDDVVSCTGYVANSGGTATTSATAEANWGPGVRALATSTPFCGSSWK